MFKSGGESLERPSFEKIAHSCFNAGAFNKRFMSFSTRLEIGNHIVFIEIGFGNLLDVSSGGLIHSSDQISNPIAIHIVAESDLGFTFISLGDSHIPHVITKAGNLSPLPVCPGAGGSRPCADLSLDILFLP